MRSFFVVADQPIPSVVAHVIEGSEEIRFQMDSLAGLVACLCHPLSAFDELLDETRCRKCLTSPGWPLDGESGLAHRSQIEFQISERCIRGRRRLHMRQRPIRLSGNACCRMASLLGQARSL